MPDEISRPYGGPKDGRVPSWMDDPPPPTEWERRMSAAKQLAWLATYDRETGALSIYPARHCGYGDMERAGYVVNRGAGTIIDLFITEAGKKAVEIHGGGITPLLSIKPVQ